MRLHLIAVGRAKGAGSTLFEDYLGRLAPLPWGPLAVREVEGKRGLAGPELKRHEAALILSAIPAGARVLALDERGRDLDSRAFATLVARFRDEGARDLASVIGGADGLDETVRARADAVVAFGRLTWPHQMVRAMLAEQLYRAQTILAGHPYHRD